MKLSWNAAMRTPFRTGRRRSSPQKAADRRRPQCSRVALRGEARGGTGNLGTGSRSFPHRETPRERSVDPVPQGPPARPRDDEPRFPDFAPFTTSSRSEPRAPPTSLRAPTARPQQPGRASCTSVHSHTGSAGSGAGWGVEGTQRHKQTRARDSTCECLR